MCIIVTFHSLMALSDAAQCRSHPGLPRILRRCTPILHRSHQSNHYVKIRADLAAIDKISGLIHQNRKLGLIRASPVFCGGCCPKISILAIY